VRNTDAIIFVIDSCKEDRIEEAKLELFNISKYRGAVKIPILILANKQDLPGALSVRNIEAQLGLDQLWPEAPIYCQATCGITGEGLEEGMDKLHEFILQRRNFDKCQGLRRVTSKHDVRPAKIKWKVKRSNSYLF